MIMLHDTTYWDTSYYGASQHQIRIHMYQVIPDWMNMYMHRRIHVLRLGGSTFIRN